MAKSKTPAPSAPGYGGGFTSPALPELFGYALEGRDGKFIACRISTLGAREYIGPKQANGEPRPESKALALSRMFEALKAEYTPERRMRFA